MNDDIEDLDLSWIQDFEKIDNEYKMYYTEEISFIRIHSIYLNLNNEIDKMSEEKILLKRPGILLKEELLSIIKHNSFSNIWCKGFSNGSFSTSPTALILSL